MALTTADAALEIGLLVPQESEARPGLQLHIFLQMPGDHIDLFAVFGLLWCVLLPVQRHSPGELVILWHMQYALVQGQGFSNITSTGRRISLPNMRRYGVNFVVS